MLQPQSGTLAVSPGLVRFPLNEIKKKCLFFLQAMLALTKGGDCLTMELAAGSEKPCDSLSLLQNLICAWKTELKI